VARGGPHPEPGDVIGHYLVVGPAPSIRGRAWFVVEAECGNRRAMELSALNAAAAVGRKCRKCRSKSDVPAPTPGARATRETPGKMREPSYVRCRHPRRIGDLASTVACGGLVEVGKEQDHLRDVHRTEGGDWFEALRPSRDEEEAA
jgi:hypothetical protein